MDNFKLKLSIFILLILVLLGTLYYGIFGFSVSYLSEAEIKETRKLKEDLISYFKINDIDTVYDIENDIYYYSIPSEYENKKYTLKLNLDSKYKYKIVKHNTNIITVDYNKTYKIIIYNDKNYYETKLKLTNLPLISIISDVDITDSPTNSVFKYINPSNLDKVLSYNSKIHIRGASSKNFNKKAYKIEMYNSDYDNEKLVNISNFYYGSSFILDAMYRDNSKVRNFLATQIWNDIAKEFTNVNVCSEYVEVFINGKYNGLYVFTEPVNRRNLNLNKSSQNDTSVVLKSSAWYLPEFYEHYNLIDDVYEGYELKYPNNEELFNVSWNSILTKLSKYYPLKTKNNYSTINNIFNLENYMNLVLYNSFIDNEDNGMVKNNYFYQKTLNDKIYIQPWDMEYSMGLSYSETTPAGYDKTLDDYKNISFDINHPNSKRITESLISKYWKFRKTVFSEQYLDNLLDEYKEILNKGSAKRDSEIWLEYNIEEEIEDVRTWLHNRIEVYDNYVKGLENE